MSKRLRDNYDVRSNIPLDKRFNCNTLDEIDVPYDGLITYQKSDKKYYEYKNGTWSSQNQELLDSNQIITNNLNTKASKSVLLYDNAINSQIVNRNYIRTAKKAINNKTLNVTFWGDSITEGISQLSNKDAYPSRIETYLRSNYPSVSITVNNFAIEGTTLSNALDDNYTATNPSTSGHFWRNWATVGKKWKDHIKDTNPDLLFVAFGMNDAYGVSVGSASNNFITQLTALINYVKTFPKVPSIVVVTPMCYSKSSNLGEYSNPTMEINVRITAKLLREYCYNNGISCVDVNRISRILRDGKDDLNRIGVRETTNTIGNCSDFDLKFSIAITDGYIGMFSCRQTSVANSGYGIVFYPNSVYVYNALNSTGVEIKTTSYSSLIGSTADINIIMESSKMKVYVNGVLVIDIKDYANLYEGGITLPSNATNVVMTYLNENSSEPIYEENTLIGQYPVNSALSGNGINHPTGFGHLMIYYNTFKNLLNALAVADVNRVFTPTKIITSDWTKADSSWLTPSGKDLYFYLIGGYDEDIAVQDITTNLYYGKSTSAVSPSTTNTLGDAQYASVNSGGALVILLCVPTGGSVSNPFNIWSFK